MKYTFLNLMAVTVIFALLCAILAMVFRKTPRVATRRAHGTPRSLWRGLFATRRAPRIVLANGNTFPGQLGFLNADGRIDGFVDAGVSLPVAQRFLIWKFGADANHFAIAGAADYPLGASPDSPSATVIATALQMSVFLFGSHKGALIGISLGAITHGNPIGTAAGGKVQDLTLAGNGNYWLVGYALNDVAVANAEVSYNPQSPRQVTITGGAISAVLQ